VAEVVRTLDADGVPLLVVGGGSNLVVGDDVSDLVAVVLEDGGQAGDRPGESGLVRAFAGLVWDDVVAATVEAGLGGLECLSGIPGSVGATPVQNVGAYGAEVAQTLHRVQLFDRATGDTSWVPPGVTGPGLPVLQPEVHLARGGHGGGVPADHGRAERTVAFRRTCPASGRHRR
jgi:UDP-N-acetylmuramate dehydrogenase